MTAIIHIGSSKSLSTSIHSYFQALSDDFFYFGVNFDIQKFKAKGMGGFFLDEDCRELTTVLSNLDRFKGLDPELKQNIQKKVKLASDQNKIFFYSNEGLCETPSLYLTMKILKEIFNDFKILYIVRNQFDLIRSLYFYEGHKSFYLIGKQKYKLVPFSTFFDNAVFNHKNIGGKKSYFWIHNFIRIYNFYENIETISKFIPEENILTFPFETIEEKKDLSLIKKFIGKKTNKEFSNKILNNVEVYDHINISNKSSAFFKTYAILSALNIDPHKLNLKVKKFINYKKFFRNFKDLRIEDKYFFKIKELYLEDNLKLIEKFDSLKEHRSKYLFEK